MCPFDAWLWKGFEPTTQGCESVDSWSYLSNGKDWQQTKTHKY